MEPYGPVRLPGAPTPPCAMHFEWPTVTDSRVRPPVAQIPPFPIQSERPAGADGPVRPFVERPPSFVMGSERPTGTDGLVSPPGRQALSPEYPSSIADALRREQAIFRRVLAAKRRRDEQPPAYEEVVSYAQTPSSSRPGDRPAEAEAQLWRPPTRISSPEPD